MPGAEIRTELDDVQLRELTVEDADALFEVIDRNRAHLHRLGDYRFPQEYSADDVQRKLSDASDEKLRYGIWVGGRLSGRIDLVPIAPPHWSIGYFLAEQVTGRGIATATCIALAPVAREAGAVDLYGGVTLGNDKSCAVLRRAGYELIQTMSNRTRRWLPLAAEATTPVMMDE